MRHHCALCQPTARWVHPELCGQQGEGGGLQLCSCWETSPGALRLDGECSVQERHGAVGEHPEEGTK